MILLIDHYDSFSFNLYQFIGTLNSDIKVVRSDELTVPEVLELNPSHIVLSPGPGRPNEAGIYETLIPAVAGKIPLLGVCLGHQALAESFGGTVGFAKTVMHGKSSEVNIIKDSKLFEGLPKHFEAARYHSLAVDRASLPEELVVTAETADGEIMDMEHKSEPLYGVQFHPESILTPHGIEILKNFLNMSV